MRNLVALLLMLVSGKAVAMACFVPEVGERYRSSSHVILVEVMEARIDQPDAYPSYAPGAPVEIEITDKRIVLDHPRRILVRTRVIESYKGEAPPTELIVYGGEVTVGAMYLLYVDDDPNVSLDCDGMPRISPFAPEDLQLLEQLRALKKAKPRPAK
jgi:hypothetical protein